MICFEQSVICKEHIVHLLTETDVSLMSCEVLHPQLGIVIHMLEWCTYRRACCRYKYAVCDVAGAFSASGWHVSGLLKSATVSERSFVA